MSYLIVIVAIVAGVLFVVRMKMREREMKRF
jgi:hypothetical protein